MVRRRWLMIATCALVALIAVPGWRRSDPADRQVVVRVRGVVLDANRLPERMPVPRAAVVIEGLRGTLVRVGTVRTRTNAQGEFDLQVPMREAWAPFWRGSIWAEAFGYDESSVLCCSSGLETTTCSPGPCAAGASAYVAIGLSGSSPPPLAGEAIRFLGLRTHPGLLLAIVLTLGSLGVIWGVLALARLTWPHRLSWMPSGPHAARTTSLRLGLLALALSVSAAGMPWYEWTLRNGSGPYVFSGRVVREQSGVWGPPVWSWDRPPLPNEYLRKPLPSQDIVAACGLVCLVLILLCLGGWLLSLRQALGDRFRRGKATLLAACAGVVLCIGIVLALGPWTLFEELILAPMGFWHFEGTFTAALDRVRVEGPLTLSLGVVLAGIARVWMSVLDRRDAVLKSKLLPYSLAGLVLLALLAGPACGRKVTSKERDSRIPAERTAEPSSTADLVTVFMCGDVMTGRGIDQVLPHPGDPRIHEPYVESAREYVALAEQAHGPLQKPVGFAYIWGDALEELERVQPDVRLINLETSVTRSDDYWKGKGVTYRMNPPNVPCLTAARIDCCSLANNHVLDWGYAGLAETLETLRKAQIHTAGAGQDLQEAEAPAVIQVEGKARVLIFSYGVPTSGIPVPWGAAEGRAGVNLIETLSDQAVRRVKQSVAAVERQGDLVVVSIHWGSNWGYDVPPEQVAFAHKLIDEAGVDIVHGHSSHHVKGIEVYKDRLVLYGCGDFLNDYEGIGGYERFRGDLALMYFAGMDPATGRLVYLQMTPMQTRYLRANRASRADALWLREVLNGEGQKLGTWVKMDPGGTLTLKWAGG